MARGSGLWIWGLGYLGLSRITRLLLATAGLHTPFCSPQEMTPGPMSTSCALVSTEYEALANDEPFPQKISSMAGRVNWTGDPINFVYSTPPSVHCPPHPLLSSSYWCCLVLLLARERNLSCHSAIIAAWRDLQEEGSAVLPRIFQAPKAISSNSACPALLRCLVHCPQCPGLRLRHLHHASPLDPFVLLAFCLSTSRLPAPLFASHQ